MKLDFIDCVRILLHWLTSLEEPTSLPLGGHSRACLFWLGVRPEEHDEQFLGFEIRYQKFGFALL